MNKYILFIFLLVNLLVKAQTNKTIKTDWLPAYIDTAIGLKLSYSIKCGACVNNKSSIDNLNSNMWTFYIRNDGELPIKRVCYNLLATDSSNKKEIAPCAYDFKPGRTSSMWNNIKCSDISCVNFVITRLEFYNVKDFVEMIDKKLMEKRKLQELNSEEKVLTKIDDEINELKRLLLKSQGPDKNKKIKNRSYEDFVKMRISIKKQTDINNGVRD